MDFKKNIQVIQELIDSDVVSDEQKEALDKAIVSMHKDQWMEALKILAPIAAAIFKLYH